MGGKSTSSAVAGWSAVTTPFGARRFLAVRSLSMSRDEATLLDLERAARLIIEFTRGMDAEDFLDDVKTQSAVLHQLLVLGEAVKRLSPAFRGRYPSIPWALIAGMRDNLIHEYDTVDLDEVWSTAERDVPRLLLSLNLPLPPDETGDRNLRVMIGTTGCRTTSTPLPITPPPHPGNSDSPYTPTAVSSAARARAGSPPASAQLCRSPPARGSRPGRAPPRG